MIMDIFTSRFNGLIKENNIKQAELADILKVSRQCINDYVKGRNYPSLPVIVDICKYFDVSADYLLGISDNY